MSQIIKQITDTLDIHHNTLPHCPSSPLHMDFLGTEHTENKILWIYTIFILKIETNILDKNCREFNSVETDKKLCQ